MKLEGVVEDRQPRSGGAEEGHYSLQARRRLHLPRARNPLSASAPLFQSR